MNTELEAKLRSKYPAIFANWDTALSESAMPLGVQCGDGWFDMIDALCRALQVLTDEEGAPQTIAVQVKQKFGTLRFHTLEPLNDKQSELIREAQVQSSLVCDVCGSAGQLLTLTPRKVAARCAVHTAE